MKTLEEKIAALEEEIPNLPRIDVAQGFEEYGDWLLEQGEKESAFNWYGWAKEARDRTIREMTQVQIKTDIPFLMEKIKKAE